MSNTPTSGPPNSEIPEESGPQTRDDLLYAVSRSALQAFQRGMREGYVTIHVVSGGPHSKPRPTRVIKHIGPDARYLDIALNALREMGEIGNARDAT